MQLYKNDSWKELKFNTKPKKIPETWEKVSIGNIIKPNDKSKLKASEGLKEGEYPFFNCSETQTKFCNTFLVDGENIFITTGGDYMFNLYFNGKSAYSTDVWAVKIENNNAKFIDYFLKYNFTVNQEYFRGFKFKHLDKKGFKNMDISLPPLKEQEKIAYLLSCQETLINKTKDLISNIEKRNKFMIDELLSGNLRVKNNEDNIVFYRNKKEDWKSITLNSEKINIPNEWNKCNLGSDSIPFVKSGVKKYEGIIDYYATGEVSDFSLGKSPTGSFIYSDKPSRANLKVFGNTVYLARMKNTLKILKFENDENFLLSSGFLGLKPKLETILLDYLYYTIISDNFQKIKNKECKGATQETLSDGAAEKIEILVPSIEEQKLISTSLKSMFNELEKYKKILEKEEKTFTFLLEELMSGRLRIKI